MQRLGRYVLEGELGRGAMGVVFRARDPRIDRVVALKALRPDAAPDPAAFAEVKQRFLNEAKAAGRLSHPNIVTVHDAGEDEATGTAYMAMEFVPGVELKDLIKNGIGREQLLKIVDDVAGALDHAHSRGVVHRDVKPANILLDEEGRARLTDFGIARLAASTMTQDGAFLGSPAYMSPEQVRSQEITGKSDVFSLGVVIFECLTGRRPFVGADLVSTTHAIANEQPQRASELQTNLPPDVDEVLQAALAKDPADRPATATALAQELRAALEGASVATLVAGRPAATTAQPRRRGLLLGGLVAAAALALLAVLAIALGGEAEPETLGGPVARVAEAPPPAQDPAPSEPVADAEPASSPVAKEPRPTPAQPTPTEAEGAGAGADGSESSEAPATGTLRIELLTFQSGVLEVLDGEAVVARQAVSELERKRGFRLKNPKRRFELACEVPAGRRMLSFLFQVEGGELLRHRAVKDVAADGTLPVIVDIGTLGRDIEVRFP